MIGGDADNVPDGVDFYKLDCNSVQALQRLTTGCEVYYHCAATAYEGLSVFSPHLVAQNIYGASAGVFSAAIENRARRIVHCSSMARYGAISTPYVEFQECAPQDPYGLAKLAVEHMLSNLCRTHGVEYVIAVPHNIYGPRQKYDDPYRNVAAIMANLMIQGRAPIIYGDGSQQRCFSYVDDCVPCLYEMGFAGDGVVGEVINIGPDEDPITITGLFETLRDVIALPYIQPRYMPARPQEVHTALCSSNKARNLLGYKTTVRLHEGLKHLVDWIEYRGMRPFSYHLPIEIVTDKTPRTWSDRLF
jgi:UDP-glucose 4-epimerase